MPSSTRRKDNICHRANPQILSLTSLLTAVFVRQVYLRLLFLLLSIGCLARRLLASAIGSRKGFEASVGNIKFPCTSTTVLRTRPCLLVFAENPQLPAGLSAVAAREQFQRCSRVHEWLKSRARAFNKNTAHRRRSRYLLRRS
jgi:hypothetical protein